MAFWRNTLLALFAILIALFLVHPIAEVGMDDDWSYIRTAHDLALTGQLRYNGWAAPIIGFQAYWAALFIRLAGFSFTITRVSVELLTVLFIPVVMRMFRAAGLTLENALFSTLALLLSPLTLPLIASFMTDVPGFLLFAAALWCALEAWKSADDKAALRWMWAAAVAGAVSGTVRQIYWAAIGWFLLVLLVKKLQGRARISGGICLAVTMGFAVAVNHWQSVQPYTASVSPAAAYADQDWADLWNRGTNRVARFFVGCSILLLPVTSVFAPRWFRVLPRWLPGVVAVAAAGLAYFLAQPLPWVGNLLSPDGVLRSGLVAPGDKPVVLSRVAILIIATTGITGLVCGLAAIWRLRIRMTVDFVRLAVLTAPFLALYVALIAARGPVFGLFDRYTLPLTTVAMVMLLLVFQRVSDKGLPAIAWVLLGVFAFYAVATTHDSFSGARARLAVAEKLRRGGLKRTEILGGFEFDCWTQVDATGYVNNDEMEFPRDAYQDADDCTGAESLQFWWRSLAPSVRADYVVTVSPLADLEPGIVDRVGYQTWLPWGTHFVYAQRSKVRLSCKAGE